MAPLHHIKSEKSILTVSQLNLQSKLLLENKFGAVWVTGEISNLARPASGHLYFTLKDANAQVRCAYFRANKIKLNTQFENGQQITALAKVSLYEPRGDYQLIINTIELTGSGILQAQFDNLKNKLSNLGLFESNKKHPIPLFPNKIGIIASPHSAAIKDIISTLKRRFPAVPLTVFPTEVQGKTAAPKIINALKIADAAICDVLILARGGGSIEDLWAFNDEQLAYTIASCKTPIVTGIGHEIDFTIADFVADLRAPTPTAAAESVTMNQVDLLEQLTAFENRLYFLIQSILNSHRRQLDNANKRLLSPIRGFTTNTQKVDHLEQRLRSSAFKIIRESKQRLAIMDARLSNQNPEKRLSYYQSQLNHNSEKLENTMTHLLDKFKSQFQALTSQLNAYSPLATLDRGYAIALKDDKVITSIHEINRNDEIKVRLKDGQLLTHVNNIEEAP